MHLHVINPKDNFSTDIVLYYIDYRFNRVVLTFCETI